MENTKKKTVKYVSDLINDEYKTWTNKKIILIQAGTGKTTFVKTSLLQYCNQNNKKILYIANRIALKLQTQNDIEAENKIYKIKDANIYCTTYQGLTWLIQHNREIYTYDYIVADETHYFFADSTFDRKTDIPFKWIIKSDAVKILMSATPTITYKYIKDELKLPLIIYKMPINYNKLLSDLYFYRSKDTIKKFLIEQQQCNINNENNSKTEFNKMIYFTSAQKAYEVSNIFDNTIFYCSKSNSLNQYNNQKAFEKIIKENKFDEQILCTTSVLDNGVNFIDQDLNIIIIDYFNPDEIIQMIGRKRFINNPNQKEKLLVLIKDHSLKQITKKVESLENRIKQIDFLLEHGEIEFGKKYYKKDIDKAIDVIAIENMLHYKINRMAYFKLKYDLDYFDQLLKYKKDGFRKDLIKRLKYKNPTMILDFLYDKSLIESYLDNLIENHIKLFNEEQKRLKEFICNNDELFNKASKNHNSLGYKMINAYFEQIGISYVIKSKRENSRKSDNRGKRYWYIDINNTA